MKNLQPSLPEVLSDAHSITFFITFRKLDFKPSKLYKYDFIYQSRENACGIDIRYIQVLGDNSNRATEIYPYIIRKAFGKIKSPLDNLDI